MTTIDLDQVRQGNRRSLAKAITLVESSLDHHRHQAQKMLEALLPYSGQSMRIGISGTPGVGKSTFIEALGKLIISMGHKIAVLAVDPSSPVVGGSILADKTRMEDIARDPNSFIRPSPSNGQLGGVATKTRESMLLCEAAGFDVILVETVGVGQSEFEVADMVDFFLVLVQPNAGDNIQAIKKGVIELAHALIINKADGKSESFALLAKRHYQSAIDLVSHSGFWYPKVITCSAIENKHIDDIWTMINAFKKQSIELGKFTSNRAIQNKAWMDKLFMELLTLKINSNSDYHKLRALLEKKVIESEITPLFAAKKMAELL